MWSLHTADSSGMYGWMDGVVRVDVVVVVGVVVEACRAVTVRLLRVIVVDVVGAAVVRIAMPARKADSMMSFMVMTISQKEDYLCCFCDDGVGEETKMGAFICTVESLMVC